MTTNKNHQCQHEEDIEDFKTELKDGDKEFKYIKDELVLIKDALGVKIEENGDRDKQIQEVFNKTNDLTKRTDDLGKKTEKEDGNLKEKVDTLSLDVAEIKGALGLAKDKSERKLSLTNVVLAAILGFAFALTLLIIQHCIPL